METNQEQSTETAVSESDTGQGAVSSIANPTELSDLIWKPSLPTDAPLEDRINEAFIGSLKLAISAVFAAVAAGKMLRAQKEKLPHGQWLPWLAAKCPDIGERTAQRLMGASEYNDAHDGYIDARTVNEIYERAGAYRQAEKGVERGPEPEKTVVDTLQKGHKMFRLFYTDALFEKLQPSAAPRLLSWVRKVKDEMVAMENRIVEKFGEVKAEI